MPDKKDNELLLEWMENEHLDPVALADKVGVTRQLLYVRLKSPKFPAAFKKKLAAAGIEIFGKSKILDNKDKDITKMFQRMEQIIETTVITQMSPFVKDFKDRIKDLEEIIELQRKSLHSKDLLIKELQKKLKKQHLEN